MSTDVSTAEAGGAAGNPTPPAAPPALSPVELGRWAWRQLTSMRTALVLLFLLALAAVPGSVVPQRNIDAVAVRTWFDDHPQLAPVYDKLGLFNVYGSPWFAAIYILLMVSLVGCVLPRLRVYWRAMRARPPRAPRNLSRLPESRTFTVDGTPDAVLERAVAVLRKRRYRVEVSTGSTTGGVSTGSTTGGVSTGSTTGVSTARPPAGFRRAQPAAGFRRAQPPAGIRWRGSGATSARPGTCCSTPRCWWC